MTDNSKTIIVDNGSSSHEYRGCHSIALNEEYQLSPQYCLSFYHDGKSYCKTKIRITEATKDDIAKQLAEHRQVISFKK